MLRQLLLGGLVSLLNIAIHAVMMDVVASTARFSMAHDFGRPRLWLPAVMVATVAILMAAHLMEVLVWALAYTILGVHPPEADTLYFALVNYTTLGYGDVLPTERWRLLGPLAAMNGILLFGWSTAVIFEVLRLAMRTIDDRRDG